MTRMPSSLLFEEKAAGVIIDYDPHQLAKATIELLRNDELLIRYRWNVNALARNFTSEIVLGRALGEYDRILSAQVQ